MCQANEGAKGDDPSPSALQSGESGDTPRCGDHVHHKPSGEDWVVAYVSGDRLAWCGWPDGTAALEDCEIISYCTDEEHLKQLRECAASSGARASHALQALRQLEEPGTGDTASPRAQEEPDTPRGDNSDA